MPFTPYGLSDIVNIIAAAYAAVANRAANTGMGSQLGPSFRANAMAAALLQNETLYIQAFARLSTMQDPLPNGQPNPDIDSFMDAFYPGPGSFRQGPSAAFLYATFSIPQALAADYTIPVGYVVGAAGGPQYTVVVNGTGFDAETGGYVIPAGQTSVAALVQCNVTGSIGNAQVGTITQVISGPNGAPPNPTLSVTNSSTASTAGLDPEFGNLLKQRFALYISGGGEGTPNSIIAAVGGFQNGLTVGYADYVKAVSGSPWTFTPATPSWFTVCVDIAGAPGTITTSQLAAIQAYLINDYRPAGAYFAVAPPTPLVVSGAGTILFAPGANQAAATAAVNAAFTSFVNNIGLDPFGNPKTCSLMGVYVALSMVPGVQEIQALQLNGGNVDVTADFGQILAAGTAAFAA